MTSGESSRPLLQRVAVITGASRGIGHALALCFAAAGCDLALCARGLDCRFGEEIAARHGTRVFARQCDVRNESSVHEFFEAIKLGFGRIDILINNAGIAGPSAAVTELSPQEWRDTIDTNLTGTFLCTRAALPWIPRGGVIVNNLSVAAKTSFAGEAAYVSAKHGAKGFTDTLRMELRERGIRVIGLYAGATDTGIWNQFWPSAPRERMMSPNTVARAVLQAIILPEDAVVEELVIAPTEGKL
jgi:NAD(P)-dependent dehydrogenase (short-subunit alcohol dehydrogenase family)